MPIDTELRALAEAALAMMGHMVRSNALAQFEAAANPTTVLNLLDRIAKLEEANDTLEKCNAEMGKDCDHWRDEVAKLEARIESARDNARSCDGCCYSMHITCPCKKWLAADDAAAKEVTR